MRGIDSITSTITKDEIVTSLLPENGKYFNVPDLIAYADKVNTFGKALVVRDDSGTLLSYILYYDNAAQVFITMVWTNSNFRGKGYAATLLKHLIASTNKDILLEVHPENPAKLLYHKLNFKFERLNGTNEILKFVKFIAINQPYIFPYLGYFQLIYSADSFIFYDDVNFIKQGWINRNKILVGGEAMLFTVPLQNQSSFTTIMDTKINKALYAKWCNKFIKTLEQNYKNAPFYEPVSEMVFAVLNSEHVFISDLAIDSVVKVFSYLGIDCKIERASQLPQGFKDLERSNRLIAIAKSMGYSNYINPIGGQELYKKEFFEENGVTLSFLSPSITNYKQFEADFVPGLSIIDVLMFNSKKEVLQMMSGYNII
jgi:predicted GNAT family acetyltransferase